LLLEAGRRVSGTDQDRGCDMIPKSGYRFSDKIMQEKRRPSHGAAKRANKDPDR
jgi:hypothetical protein